MILQCRCEKAQPVGADHCPCQLLSLTAGCYLPVHVVFGFILSIQSQVDTVTSAFSRAGSLTHHKGAPGFPLEVFALISSHIWVCGCSQQDSRPKSYGFSVLPAFGAAVGTHSAIFSFLVWMLRSQVNLSHLPGRVQTRSLLKRE